VKVWEELVEVHVVLHCTSAVAMTSLEHLHPNEVVCGGNMVHPLDWLALEMTNDD